MLISGVSGGVTGDYFLFMSLFEPILMFVLLTKILLLYPFVFLMFKFKLLGNMYIPTPTEKSTFDNA